MTDIDTETLNRISEAVYEGHLEEVKRLLAERPEFIQHRNRFSEYTWLQSAAEEGHRELLEYLFELGIPLNTMDSSKECPLSMVARIKDFDFAKWMIDNGADPNISDWPMVSAVSAGNLDIVKLFIEHGANYNFLFGEPLRSPLSQAIDFGHTEVADYLRSLDAMVPPDWHDATGGAVSEEDDDDDALDLETDIHVYFELRTDTDRLPDAMQEIVPGKTQVAVWTVPSLEPGGPTLLYTTGLSSLPMTVPQGSEQWRYAELAMYLPPDWPTKPDLGDESKAWPWKWLRNIAHYPHEHDTWLGDALTTFANEDPPKPLGPGSDFTAFLLYPNCGNLRGFDADVGHFINFFTVMPIYAQECALAKQEGGTQKLFDRFAAIDFSGTLQPGRPNVGLEK